MGKYQLMDGKRAMKLRKCWKTFACRGCLASKYTGEIRDVSPGVSFYTYGRVFFSANKKELFFNEPIPIQGSC